MENVLATGSSTSSDSTAHRRSAKHRRSCGIIIYRNNSACHAPERRQYLMIRRKHSIGYDEFVRDKWRENTLTLLQSLCNDMTVSEREKIGHGTCEELELSIWQPDSTDAKQLSEAWTRIEAIRKGYWLDIQTNLFAATPEELERLVSPCSALSTPPPPPPPDAGGAARGEGEGAGGGKNGGERYKRGGFTWVSWATICANATPGDLFPAVEFPKGRRDSSNRESSIACAQREVQEETNLMPDSYVLQPLQPVYEIFTGLNGILYNYSYYVARLRDDCTGDEVCLNPLNREQAKEVGHIGWYTYEEAMACIRKGDVAKRQVLQKVHSTLASTTPK